MIHSPATNSLTTNIQPLILLNTPFTVFTVTCVFSMDCLTAPPTGTTSGPVVKFEKKIFVFVTVSSTTLPAPMAPSANFVGTASVL